jgi:hypothetical protein
VGIGSKVVTVIGAGEGVRAKPVGLDESANKMPNARANVKMAMTTTATTNSPPMSRRIITEVTLAPQ